MSSPSASIKFRSEWGDHKAGATVSFPEPMARHLVDCGIALFVEAAPVEPEPAERADARPVKNLQRATK